MNIFVYGTLLSPDIWQHVVHKNYKQEKAILKNFESRKIQNEVYPAIIPHDGTLVEGIVYYNVDAIDVQHLDIFEGEEYLRTLVQIETITGEKLTAMSYLYKERFWHKLTSSPWFFEEFLTKGKSKFMETYLGWQQLSLQS